MEQNKLTLGSLFDGSGGFPLGGLLSGITPVWASEIEPFPIRVTTKRLPFMKHYGDVSKMDGADVEPVDIITFGSPCQDMSIARPAGRSGRLPLQPVLRSRPNRKRNEVCDRWKTSKVYRLGKRPRRVQLQQGRGLPVRPRRDLLGQRIRNSYCST